MRLQGPIIEVSRGSPAACFTVSVVAQTVTAGSSSQEKEKDKTSDGDTTGPAGEPEKSHSNSSTLSDRRHSDSSLCSIEEEHRHVYDMVHAILLSTRDNVNFVNEVFHQVQRGHQVMCVLFDAVKMNCIADFVEFSFWVVMRNDTDIMY